MTLMSNPAELTLAGARHGDADAFRQLTDPLRRELLLHCYRMMGSLHDAEDLVQETLLRAWRRLDTFQGRSSFRAWLYRVATNTCLNALERRRREPPAAPQPHPSNAHADAVPHLQPYPDVLLGELDLLADTDPTPEARYELRESISLAFQVAIQLLPPRQRAALILSDVLGFAPAEIAGTLNTSVVAVNSALQRARAAVRRHGEPVASLRPINAAGQQLAERFALAWEHADFDLLVSLLAEDAILTMPPQPVRVVGQREIAEFFTVGPICGKWQNIRLLATSANGQPAFAGYLLDPATGLYHAHGMMVLTLNAQAITAITGFADAALVGLFGLPDTVHAAPVSM
jgi:RNA polymerase sigma-70 factor (TIGR02960 family)